MVKDAFAQNSQMSIPFLGVLAGLNIFFFFPAFSMNDSSSLASFVWRVGQYQDRVYLCLVPVPVIFLVLLADVWRKSRPLEVRPSYLGIVPLLVGLVVFWCGLRLAQLRVGLFGLPFLVFGGLLYGAGKEVARRAVFASFFLWFLIPLPGLAAFVDLRVAPFMAMVTTWLGDLLGLGISKAGTDLISAERNFIWDGS